MTENRAVPLNAYGEPCPAYVSPEQRARIDRAAAHGYELGWDAARAAYEQSHCHCPICKPGAKP